MIKEFFQSFKRYTKEEVDLLNPLLLAYIGDAIFELFIRVELFSKGIKNVKELNKSVREYVMACAQSNIMKEIYPLLNDEEVNVLRRGRNAKSTNIPKSSKVIEYKYATGFEALLGYLFLLDRIDRLMEILKLSLECIKGEENKNES